jgi:hypothetical protein
LPMSENGSGRWGADHGGSRDDQRDGFQGIDGPIGVRK